MSRLVVISNRVSAPTGEGGAGAQGGLAVALGAALREYRGLWFGWSGHRTDEFTGHIELQRAHGVTTATIDLEDQDVDEYYNGYANRTLWPLFHYRIDLAEYDRSFDSGYQRVNERFAETVTPLIDQDDLVWVHDYHLIPLGAELRARGLKNRIGFFLHIPWPPGRLLVSLPDHQKLVRSLLAYDLIGFQTREWLEAFRDYVVRELGGNLDADGTLHVGDRTVHVAAYPIGIDYDDFMEASRSPLAHQACNRLRESAADRKVIIGVDRLDYSKGLQERFTGYQRFLENNPDRHGELFMLQIAPPTREEVSTYEEIRDNLDGLSGRINGAFAEIDWVPVRYVNQGYDRASLAGFYRAAQIALITPLRDGMNLVAKEYVAAQDPDDPGVLILSRFAGAALQLKDALLVNPYSADEVSDAIKTALEMPREERIRRWRSMMESVRDEDVVKWRHDFVAALEGARIREPEPPPEGK
ncbi:alpha,alpha-trehalose-phosphate synthase (UDP-forming) [Allosphingosinicella flava]|uniref:Trehalose-6-phosphate synthase n=1 Tax=Allosphingosinicella flava TaxID=2771430 RepID=A0A7T2GLD8_9SPHN|nr:alpha,alpha-trehalose-phosphate synthase (UDP-forming) [Sphingosinicella flava]QPQ56011.1 alpha,alpha-trehalose-phosphate synthase (UDP-forming) [Sphingosinicella flava]